MAVFVLKNAFVKINNIDLSDRVKKVSINYSADEEDTTTMGSNSKKRVATLKDFKVTVEFAQDFASDSVDATLFSLVGADSFPVEIRPDAGVASATNPKFTGNCILTEYSPLDGQVGSLATTSVTLNGDGDLTRATV